MKSTSVLSLIAIISSTLLAQGAVIQRRDILDGFGMPNINDHGDIHVDRGQERRDILDDFDMPNIHGHGNMHVKRAKPRAGLIHEFGVHMKRAQEVGAHWTYGEDNRGPQNWGNLDPQYSSCSQGKRQSPIDVSIGAPVVVKVKTPLKLKYNIIKDLVIGYNGHTVQADIPDPFNTTATNKPSTLTIKDKVYYLVQFHFHTPSEHRVNNKYADAELHLVHKNPVDDSIAVIGVLLEVGTGYNPSFAWINALEAKEKHDKNSGSPASHSASGEGEHAKITIPYFDLKPILHDTNNFTPRWEYAGSLTTPPCTENVAWHLAKTPVRIGLKQFDVLTNLQGFNSRFIQNRTP